MADQEAEFNEVLSISINPEAFQASLNEIRGLWESFLAELGGAEALSIVGADAFVGIKEAVADLKTVIQDMFGAATDGAQVSAEAQVAAVEEVNAAQESAAQKQRERAKATAQVEIDAATSVTATLNDKAALLAAKRELADDLVKTTPAMRFGQDIGNEQEGEV